MIVGQHAVADAAAQQIIDGPAEGLAFDIPKRDVDGGDSGGLDALRREKTGAEKQLPNMLGAEGVFANEQRFEMFDGALHRQLAPGDAGLAQAADAGVRLDDDKAVGAPLFRQIYFDIGNFHSFVLRSRWRRRALCVL